MRDRNQQSKPEIEAEKFNAKIYSRFIEIISPVWLIIDIKNNG